MKQAIGNKNKEPKMADSEFMIASEVARLKEVTPATVRAWNDRGILPAKRTPNGTRIFLRSDVEKFEVPSRCSKKR
jgi:DNA-binding transcriptional MerR regulator